MGRPPFLLLIRTLILVGIIAVAANLLGCGQTGPLYLPDDPSKNTEEKPKQPRS